MIKILKSNLQIAIDGPVAAGKGTVSKLLAEKLNILYVDTGAMYRALTLFIKENNIDWEDETAINKLIQTKKPLISLNKPQGNEIDGRLVTVLLNNKDVSWDIRTEKVSYGVSIITQYKIVRDYMVKKQQLLASQKSVVMEGRDITTRVLPHADLKIYLDANPEIRAKRRYEELLSKNQSVTFESVKKELIERDYRDSHRQIDPLSISSDAWILDTSNYSIDQVITLICSKLKEKTLINFN